MRGIGSKTRCVRDRELVVYFSPIYLITWCNIIENANVSVLLKSKFAKVNLKFICFLTQRNRIKVANERCASLLPLKGGTLSANRPLTRISINDSLSKTVAIINVILVRHFVKFIIIPHAFFVIKCCFEISL